LGLAAGRIAPGCWADFMAIDLAVESLAGWEPDTLLEALLFGAGREAIAATAVGGTWQPAAGSQPTPQNPTRARV
ncbi:MAG: formimidoylglutamate deiminase, partial [Acidobacteriota bacterium]|nr:formimidoylglutamate deiminase [Acidobacteriota bacterium]